MGKIKLETVRKRVKDSLKEQLEQKGVDIYLFEEQINDYMTMWDLKEKLKEDIKKNGLRLEYSAANGGKVEKDNPSVKQIPIINKQMLMLLKQLDVSTDNIIKGSDDTDDEL